MAVKISRMHADTMFDSLLNDGFFIGMLILLIVTVIFLVFKYFDNK